MSGYRETFEALLVAIKRTDVPWQVAEAFAREEWGTLGSRSRADLKRACRWAAAGWDHDFDLCIRHAESHGFDLAAFKANQLRNAFEVERSHAGELPDVEPVHRSPHRKIANEYSGALGALFKATPKHVLAAIAASFASCGGDRIDEAEARVLREWWTLFENGIVPQRPPFPKPGDEFAA